MATRYLEGSGAKVVSDNPKTDFYHVVEVMSDIAALLNELRTDSGTDRTTLLALETLTEELGADHATFKSAVNDLVERVNQYLTRETADMVLPGAVAGLSVDGVNPENAETDNTIYIRHKGQLFSIGAIAELDISALTAGGDTITQDDFGVLWIFANPAGTGDAETDKAASDYTSLIEALAQYSVATNTLPPGTDDVCIGLIYIEEDNSGAFTWGTDSLTGESATYVDLFGLPGVVTAMASFALDAGAPTFTYGAATIRLGSGTQVSMSGKANVTISGTNVADGAVGAWLFYGLADDVEIAVQLGAAYADLATAQAAVRDHTPNPYLPLMGVLYVANASGADFVPGTTNLDATNITATFVTIGPTTDQLEVGRAALNQAYSALTNDAPATLAASTSIDSPAAAVTAAAVDDFSFKTLGTP